MAKRFGKLGTDGFSVKITGKDGQEVASGVAAGLIVWGITSIVIDAFDSYRLNTAYRRSMNNEAEILRMKNKISDLEKKLAEKEKEES